MLIIFGACSWWNLQHLWWNTLYLLSQIPQFDELHLFFPGQLQFVHGFSRILMVNVPVFWNPLRRRCASPRRRGLRGAGRRDVQGGAQHGHGGGCLHQDAVVAVPAEGCVWFIRDGFLNPFMLILGMVTGWFTIGFTSLPHYGITITGCWWMEHDLYDFPFSWEFHHPNWLSYFSEGLTPPTSSGLYNGDLMVMVIFHGDWDHFQLGIPLVVYQ